MSHVYKFYVTTKLKNSFFRVLKSSDQRKYESPEIGQGCSFDCSGNDHRTSHERSFNGF